MEAQNQTVCAESFGTWNYYTTGVKKKSASTTAVNTKGLPGEMILKTWVHLVDIYKIFYLELSLKGTTLKVLVIHLIIFS